MSSLRNAVQRRNHKERSQPQNRQKWGLLEKRKDYQLRATDNKVKKRKIQALQQKAEDRNEDEFYFAMINSQSRGGIRQAQRGGANSGGAQALNASAVKLMKTQDAGYLRTMLQQTKKEKDRAEEEVVIGTVGVPLAPTHDRRRRGLGEGGAERTHPAATALSTKHSPVGSEEEDAEESETGPTDPTLATKRRKLQRLEERERDLAAALHEVEQQQSRMSGTSGGVNKKGVRFKVRQRKR